MFSGVNNEQLKKSILGIPAEQVVRQVQRNYEADLARNNSL